MIKVGTMQLILAPISPRQPQPVTWLARKVVQPVLDEVGGRLAHTTEVHVATG